MDLLEYSQAPSILVLRHVQKIVHKLICDEVFINQNSTIVELEEISMDLARFNCDNIEEV